MKCVARKTERRKQRPAGYSFTLIELMVVVSISAILAAMLFPALSKSKQKVFEISCVSNLRQIGVACSLYNVDYNEFLPPRKGGPDLNVYWLQMLYQIAASRELKAGDNIWVVLSARKSIFPCPAWRNDYQAATVSEYARSIGYLPTTLDSSSGATGGFFVINDFTATCYTKAHSTKDFKPSSVLMYDRVCSIALDKACNYGGNVQDITAGGLYDGGIYGASARHLGNRANYLCWDGSVLSRQGSVLTNGVVICWPGTVDKHWCFTK